jgi:S-DNA-T family DNA segregation ATPase FtsK/SpoIIIE
MQFDILPEAGIKGRGLAYVDGRILEYQTALAVQADNDYQRMDKIREICKQMSVAWKGKCARPVPEIPAKPEWTEFERLEDFEKMCKSPNYLPIGYDEANASVYGIPLREMYCYLIWGAAKTGKTNLLKACIESAMQKGSQICIIDDPQASLQSYKNVENICYVTDEDGIYQFFAALLPEFKKRNVLKQSLIQEDLEDNEIFDRMSKETPYFIFISDLSWFVPLVYNAEQDKQVSGFLENIIAKGSLHNIYFISELALANRSIVSGYKIYELFAGYKKGIHLGGKVTDNMVLNFDYLPFMEQAKSEKIGIGQIPDVVGENQTQKVVIPLVKKRKNGAKL